MTTGFEWYQIRQSIASRLPFDGVPLPIYPPYFAEVEPFVGFAANGDVAIAAFREIAVPYGAQIEWLVLSYSSSGSLTGVGRRWPRTFSPEFAHDLAFDPDGQVYQLVSHPDRTVQVVRLGFQPSWEALPEPPPQPTALPIATPLTPLQPPWQAPPLDATELEMARHALISFFAHLNDRQYAQAADYFGGPIDYIVELGVPAGGGADFWQHACSIMMCMPLSAIYSEERVAEDEFVSYVGFIFMDGSRFEYGACCGGDQAAFPPVWQFAYPVKKLDGQWKVMRGPLYVP